MTDTAQFNGPVYFEIKRVGSYLRCTAIDGNTGVEATVLGPVSKNPEQLKRVALQKLEYILNRGI